MKRHRQQIILLAVVAVGLGIATLAHTSGLNGPSYWQWTWQRIAWIWVYPGFILASLPFFLGQLIFDKDPAQVRRGLAWVAVSSLLLQWQSGFMNQGEISFGWMVDVVTSPTATSYFSAASATLQAFPQNLHDASLWQQLSSWLAEYTDVLPYYPLHARNKPPGPVLYYIVWLKIFGKQLAPFVGGLVLSVASSMAVPATYGLMRNCGFERGPSFAGASYLALCPGFILFFPEFDQFYPVLSCLLLICWLRALDDKGWRWPVATGLVLSLILFWTYSLLVLGAFMLVVAVLSKARDAQHEWLRAGILVLATTLAVQVLTFALTGYDPVGVFAVALGLQAELSTQWGRSYPGTIPFDYADFALGIGWIGALLIAFGLAQRKLDIGAKGHRLMWLALLQIVLVGASGLLRTETARVWLFLYPLAMLPIGSVLDRWGRASRLLVFSLLIGLLAVIGQNMLFIPH